MPIFFTFSRRRRNHPSYVKGTKRGSGSASESEKYYRLINVIKRKKKTKEEKGIRTGAGSRRKEKERRKRDAAHVQRTRQMR